MSLFKNSLFVRFYLSRTSANIADSIYSIVLLYFIQKSTASVSFTSFTFTAISAASIFSFLLGPLVDRYSPSLLASISLFVQAVLILAVPFLITDGGANLLTILILVFVASCFSMLFYPANNKMLPQLIQSPDRIVKANAMISSTDQLINVAGYLVGASIILLLGMKNTFYLASGMLFLSGLIYVQLKKQMEPEKNTGGAPKGPLKIREYTSELVEGYRFVAGNPFLRIMLPFFALTNFSMSILIITVPSMSVSYGSPIYYSLLYIAFFVGIFVGSALINVLKKNGLMIAISWLLMGASLYLFAIVPALWMKLSAILLMGVFTGIINVLQTSLIQIITPPQLMGRVMAFLHTLSNAALPLGAFIGGILALRFELDSVLFISALVIVACGVLLLALKAVRTFQIPSETADKEKTEDSLAGKGTVAKEFL
ncbi:macrolide transporter [Paenibacillus chitinolyticus]|uniref:MFS transporter n=1 Tax=Paenibacillus chitinolyticus TaxID=79263 RepID=UPI0026E4C624|nr:MFS transporter [Paenibacillus chitinolyticus]GKS11277.1 macrolide transporter [Paenibacillus chitinolyticus]